MREQQLWNDHALFMNSLVDDGFVILGGPLHNPTSHRARLIVRTTDEVAVRRRLAEDPWSSAGILDVMAVGQWEVLLSRET